MSSIKLLKLNWPPESIPTAWVLRFHFEKSELQKKPLLLVEKSGRIFNACIILHHSIFDFERHRIKLLIFMQDILKCRVKPKKNFSI